MAKDARKKSSKGASLADLSAAFDAKVEDVRKQEAANAPPPAPSRPSVPPPQGLVPGGGAENAGEGAVPPTQEPVKGAVPNAKWYILQAYSNFERRVKQLIEENISLHPELAERVEEVFVPGEDVVRVKNGRKRNTHVIYFPGYVLIKMDINDHLWHFLMNIPRVSGFIGGKDGKPKPLREDELDSIRGQISEGVRQASIKEEFEIGQQVTVVEGPFANFGGQIDEVNAEKARVRVLISILGRNTPVELEFNQVRAQTEN